MMKVRIPLVCLFALLALTAVRHPDGVVHAASLGQKQQDEFALALSNVAVHPHVGLPNFTVTGSVPDQAATAQIVADVLWDDIDFEREYDMIPRKRSAAIPVAPAAALPFDQWNDLGADFVLAGAARFTSPTMLTIELRLIGIKGAARGKEYFGMQYDCGLQTARGPRDCAHAIADDFHKQERSLDGVARTKLAFSSNRDALRVTGRPSQTAGQGKEIYISDYDGANERRFTVNRSLNINPTWSPSGGGLAFTSYVSGFPDIYVANLAEPGRALTRPAHGTDDIQNFLPAWSPDGSKLAFMSNRSGNSDIWIVNRDGSDLHNLTNNPKSDFSPTWSPDGTKIAFGSDRAGSKQLYVITVEGTGLSRVPIDREIDRPTWSCLNFIAFSVQYAAGGYDIGIYDFNNPGLKILTDSVGSNESPAIAPNGRHIAFVTTRWGRKQIATIDRTGKNIRQVTNIGDNEHPTWEPFTVNSTTCRTTS
jgi:TolB protein